MVQLIKDMAEFKEVQEAQKLVLDKLSDKIVAIEKQTNKVKGSETDLMARIEQIFKETFSQIKSGNVAIVMLPKKFSYRVT